ncbi:MAG: guanylate kinase [Epsilonproteobacteria bacterium]|nr:guanylate kinase [Campylobacterota bacterium]
MNNGKLFVIAAPSGAGKTTVARGVVDKLAVELPIEKVVTYTSRPMGPGEIEGYDYYFLSPVEFKRKINEGFFLETTQYAGHYYGSPRSIINGMATGNVYVMVTDLAGVHTLKRLIPEAVMIGLYVSDSTALRDRLTKRGREYGQALEQRIAFAAEEMKQLAQDETFEYRVRNDVLDEAIQEIKNIIRHKMKN